MFAKFDRLKFKKITKINNLSQKKIAEKLTSEYFIETKVDAVKTWTRKEERTSPSVDRLNALADMCNCSIQDFFSDAERKREQITLQEISNDTEKYSNSTLNSYLLSVPNGEKVKKVLENFLNLTDEQQNLFLQQIQDTALENMKF